MEDKETKKHISELEKITRKALECVLCDIEDCDEFGEYWRCYTLNFSDCRKYIQYKQNIYKV